MPSGVPFGSESHLVGQSRSTVQTGHWRTGEAGISNYVCACSKRELRFKTKVKKVSLHTSRRTRHLDLKEGGVQQAPLPPGSIRGRGVRSVAGLTQGGLWPKTSIKVATWARGVPASES